MAWTVGPERPERLNPDLADQSTAAFIPSFAPVYMRQSSTVDATPKRPIVFQVRAIIVTGPLLVDLHIEPEASYLFPRYYL